MRIFNEALGYCYSVCCLPEQLLLEVIGVNELESHRLQRLAPNI